MALHFFFLPHLYFLLETHYDYIITGAGCAGLSLLYRMMQHPFFSNKKILVADKAEKNHNDRTWCFWETKPGMFEDVVHHKWKQVDFYSGHFSARFDIEPYTYKMIRGIDFYRFVLSKAAANKNVTIVYGSVAAVSCNNDGASVVIDGEIFTARYVFNSILFKENTPPATAGKLYHLQQHFKGWLIETPANAFDERVATFMDFRVSQQYGTTFVYVLPLAANKALVEYTLFTKSLLPQHAYDEGLQHYISNFLKLKDYIVTETEFGIIPMTNFHFSKGSGNVINLGTAGGNTKASSGYTFRFIQKHSDAVIEKLVQQKHPQVLQNIMQKRFGLYDSTLLNVLSNNKLGGDRVFADMFRKNPVQRVFRFLDNETNPVEELKLVSSVPTKVFLPAAVQELFR
ncbi:lycopene cyclase [Panacibacter sp. DH6]|uniref:Lycopene cyclase n=1 Tax=Panacibacter microcysteis TaxID=2793269 RepID=A0A931E5H9_9BACT|nr:lycopene cyclase family protein [Panacibacter microcysteis]MBG9375650.1 lycopene cyclase [Panacibacter microcysteis]